MKRLVLILLTALMVTGAAAQQSGNSAYSNNRYEAIGKPDFDNKQYLSDSTFIIQACVLKNVIADGYIATFGLAEEGLTLKECNERITERINNFIAALVKFGIQKNDIFVDMTTQNKIYDYNTVQDVAEQYLKGFELKKNVIFKFNKITDMDKMLLIAAEYKIYDIVKVDYIVNDIEGVYQELFKAASAVIEKKKALYTSAGASQIMPNATQVYGENFASFYPPQLYKSYVINESSEYYNNYGTQKKDLRKSPTFYYDKINTYGVDKVINPYVIEPAVEFVFTLQMKYKVKK
jgi:uncharacterized protein YggE